MGVRMAIEVENIVWDTDGEPVDGLPEEMSFEADFDDEEPSEAEINHAATEHMSDATGWCVTSFGFKSVAKVDAEPAPGI